MSSTFDAQLRPKRQITIKDDVCKLLGLEEGDWIRVTVEKTPKEEQPHE